MINRLVESERGTARKMLRRIKDRIALIENAFKGDKSANAALKELRKAEKLFSDALAASGEKYLHKAYVDRNEEREAQGAELDNSENVQYSKRGYTAQPLSSITKESYNHHAWATNSIDGVLSKEEIGALNSALGGIKNGDYYMKTSDGLYMVPVGENGVKNKIVFTDGKFDNYSIDTVIDINSMDESQLELIREYIYDGACKGIEIKTCELFKVHYCKDYKYVDFDGKLRSNQQYSGTEQNGARSDRKTQRNVGDTQYSLRDSEGRALTPEQVAFFKDSKVVDKDGRLQVVYHGTNADFNTFDYFKTKGGKLGYGFYFSNNKYFASKGAK